MLTLSNLLPSSFLRTLFLALIFSTIQLSITHFVYAERSGELLLESQPQDPVSQYQLAQAHESGIDLPLSTSDAFYWYTQSADNGNSDAQFRLGELYLAGTGVEQSNKLALKWLIKAALQGNQRAPIEIAKLYESSLEKAQLQPLDAALIWYEAALPDNPDAQDGYNRVLEAQFNQQRAKQISSIEKLNDSIDSEIDTSQGLSQQVQSNQASRSNLSSSNQTYSDYLIGTALAVLISIISIIATFVISRRRQALKSGDSRQQQQSFEARLSSKDLTIKQQKRQLHAMLTELKKQKNSKDIQKIQVACALFGYTPNSIPEQRSVKTRYKQLSKIYHPDASGCDEEMKRLNNALKTLLQNVTK
ncbi:tetratricopeptide repeat protein [Vibrio sp. ECSMB14106]|uniref:tetratricopeptide repeat protein n=1 Tax=Vibrio sp. ECSMB14106 TaxID=1638949 RepID=UPI0006191368|nr:tetratricopeptide repeat protein [Vibrio sp. ECSMB14106]